MRVDDEMVMQCACCGIAGVDDIKLKDCDDCDLVKYCSDECQKDHRPKHEEECQQRVAELEDELLFKQPEGSHLGDCPICCLPIPLDPTKFCLHPCCCKIICKGCNFAILKRGTEGRLQLTCSFCRKALSSTDDEINKSLMKRIEANDPAAMCHMGTEKCDEGDYTGAVEYWTRSAALGSVEAHYQLSTLYRSGEGVEKDKKRELHHLTEAAIGGHAEARYNLGYIETENCRVDRAVKHFIISAKLGIDKSLECLKDLYREGLASKEDFTAALRGYQVAIEATKSPQREEATELEKRWFK